MPTPLHQDLYVTFKDTEHVGSSDKLLLPRNVNPLTDIDCPADIKYKIKYRDYIH